MIVFMKANLWKNLKTISCYFFLSVQVRVGNAIVKVWIKKTNRKSSMISHSFLHQKKC